MTDILPLASIPRGKQSAPELRAVDQWSVDSADSAQVIGVDAYA